MNSFKVLWENYTDDPQKEAPDAYLFHQLADDEGNPAMPPVATQVGVDSRLAPPEPIARLEERPETTARSGSSRA